MHSLVMGLTPLTPQVSAMGEYSYGFLRKCFREHPLVVGSYQTGLSEGLPLRPLNRYEGVLQCSTIH